VREKGGNHVASENLFNFFAFDEHFLLELVKEGLGGLFGSLELFMAFET